MSDEESAPFKLALVRRNPWLLSLALAIFIGNTVAFFVTLMTRFHFNVFLYFILMGFFAWVLAQVWNRNPWPQETKEEVEVDERGIWVNATLLLPVDRIHSGFVVPLADDRTVVQLRRNWYSPAVEIRVENEDAGRKVLRRLSLDVSQKFVSLILPSRVNAYVWLKWILNTTGLVLITSAAIFILFMSLLWITSIQLFIAWAIGYFLLLQLTRVQLSIGADGVTLRSLYNERFLRYGDIKSISTFKLNAWWVPDWAGVQIELESGKWIRLPVAAKGKSGAARVGVVVNRLQQAFADHKQRKPQSPDTHLLRGERPLPAWIRELRRAGAGAGVSHRIAPISTEQLLDVAEDPQADPVVRANAAIALGANSEASDVRKRLRVAAQATAAPRLRVALERAANLDDEAALAEALAEVEAEAEAHKNKAE